jgi:hypothetical protein
MRRICQSAPDGNYPVKEIQNVMAEQPLNQIEEKPGYWAFPIELRKLDPDQSNARHSLVCVRALPNVLSRALMLQL